MTDDPVLGLLVDVTVTSIIDNRPLFPNPLKEPTMYTKFHRWVKEGIDEAHRTREAMAKAEEAPFSKEG